MNATQTIMDAIRMLQDEHCRRCRIGQALINLKPLLDESPPQEDRDAPSPEPMASTAPIATRTRRAARDRKPVRNLALRKPKAASYSDAPLADELDQHLTKVCSVCTQAKPLAEFPKNASCTYGRSSQCKACIAARARTRYQEKTAPAASPAAPVKTEPRKPAASGNRIADLRGIELKFPCEQCRAKFLTQQQLDNHRDLYHSKDDGDDN